MKSLIDRVISLTAACEVGAACNALAAASIPLSPSIIVMTPAAVWFTLASSSSVARHSSAAVMAESNDSRDSGVMSWNASTTITKQACSPPLVKVKVSKESTSKEIASGVFNASLLAMSEPSLWRIASTKVFISVASSSL